MSKKYSITQMQKWLETFETNIDGGLDDKDAGKFGSARKKLLRAAEALYLLADGSDKGNLREQRIRQADEILCLVENLSERNNYNIRQSANGDIDDNCNIDKINPNLLDNAPGFSDIAGLDDIKEQINLRMIAPFAHPEIAKKHGLRTGGGILMFGPPGTGKTLIAKATAKELEAAFYAIKPSEIMSKWVGESEAKIKDLFISARTQKKAVIFIDEIEALVPSRSGNNSTVMQRVVPQFLAEMEGFDSTSINPLLFIGATNEPWAIDPAMLRPGRFDVKVYVGLPDAAARRFMLNSGFSNKNLNSDLSIDYLVEMTEGYSGADIRALIDKVSQEGFKSELSAGIFDSYNLELIKNCLKTVKPSVNDKTLKKLQTWKNENT